MKLLLDTHVFLWSQTEPSRLSAKERAAVRDPGNELFLSVASAWEIEIKRAIGKLEAPDDWMERAEAFGIQWLPVLPNHVRALRLLPPIHRDPFDRILVAQSGVENLRLVTHDSILLAYFREQG